MHVTIAVIIYWVHLGHSLTIVNLNLHRLIQSWRFVFAQSDFLLTSLNSICFYELTTSCSQSYLLLLTLKNWQNFVTQPGEFGAQLPEENTVREAKRFKSVQMRCFNSTGCFTKQVQAKYRPITTTYINTKQPESWHVE